MKNAVAITLLVMSFWFGSLAVSSKSQASGQVVIQQDGTTMQLGTTISGDSTHSGTTTSSSRRTRQLSVLNSDLVIPEGFATTLANWINSVLDLILVVAALLVLTYVIWGAFDWLTSGGDKGKTESARQKITAAIVGLIIVSASYAVLLLVVQFLGFSDINDVFNNVQTLDGTPRPITTPGPSPSITPRPSATPSYTNTLEDLLKR